MNASRQVHKDADKVSSKKMEPSRFMKILTVIGALCIASMVVAAQPLVDTNELTMVLTKVPAAELPPTVVSLVNAAKPELRITTATNVLKIAIAVRPTASIMVVGVLARSAPDLADLICQTAVGQQPSLTEPLVRAVCLAAPERAGEIVRGTTQVAPGELRDILIAASDGAPDQALNILRATELLRPELAVYLENEVTRYGGRPPRVDRCFDRAVQIQLRDSKGQRHGGVTNSSSPSSRPVFKPPRGGGGPSGGRNYAKP